PRECRDAWALRSQERAAAPWDDGRLAQEVAPVYLNGHAVTADNHIRRDSTLEKLATLRPVFDREHGTITAGNASPLTDGAAAVVLASEERARALGLEPLAAVRSYAYAAVDPADAAGIARIVIDRQGDPVNAIDVRLMDDLAAAIAAARDARPRGLVISSGKDGYFVAGADLALLRGTSQSDIEKASRSMQRVL